MCNYLCIPSAHEHLLRGEHLLQVSLRLMYGLMPDRVLERTCFADAKRIHETGPLADASCSVWSEPPSADVQCALDPANAACNAESRHANTSSRHKVWLIADAKQTVIRERLLTLQKMR